MTDKYRALRDALEKCTFTPDGGHVLYNVDRWKSVANPHNVRALLADHDRMRAALRRTEFCWECGAQGAAIKTLKECEQ